VSIALRLISVGTLGVSVAENLFVLFSHFVFISHSHWLGLQPHPWYYRRNKWLSYGRDRASSINDFRWGGSISGYCRL